MHLSAAHARRFLVRRHLLDPPRSLPARPESVLDVVARLGSLQFDPLDVPGARNHELVLHARVAGYRRGWCEQWLYAPAGERRLFEAYNKSLNLLPIEELPYFRWAWTRAKARYDAGIFAERPAAVRAIVARLRKEGPLTTGHFKETHGAAIAWHWAPTAEGRAILEALFETGRVGIARREGSRRFYDLVERLFPASLLARRVPRRAAMRHRLLSRYRGHGLLGPGASTETILATGTPVERKELLASLVDDGTLVPVVIEGVKNERYFLGEERALLEASEDAPARDGVTFLAPLDPLVWDRRLLSAVFGFHYRWEVYVPEAKRSHGYYVLPILFGDRLVGRIEPRFDRDARSLTILGAWLEDGFALEAPGFLAAFARALDDYRAFVGAERVVFARTKLCRKLAASLR